jgi:hypothetical protein
MHQRSRNSLNGMDLTHPQIKNRPNHCQFLLTSIGQQMTI